MELDLASDSALSIFNGTHVGLSFEILFTLNITQTDVPFKALTTSNETTMRSFGDRIWIYRP